MWLRERAQDNTQVDQRTQQRLINPHGLPVDLAVTSAKQQEATLSIRFSDGYQGDYHIPTLLSNLSLSTSDEPAMQAWEIADHLDLVYDWQQVEHDEETFFKAVKDFLTYGYLILKKHTY